MQWIFKLASKTKAFVKLDIKMHDIEKGMTILTVLSWRFEKKQFIKLFEGIFITKPFANIQGN
jgi:hypothetical protein